MNISRNINIEGNGLIKNNLNIKDTLFTKYKLGDLTLKNDAIIESTIHKNLSVFGNVNIKIMY